MTETKDTALVRQGPMSVAPRWRMAPGSLGEAMEMASLIAGSELCPKSYRGKPQDCIIAYEYGAALGLSWMQSLRSISVINGQGALWGDAIPALIYAGGDCERFYETWEGEKNTETYQAVCIMKRRGLPDEIRRTFSVADARKANLWGKAGTWQQYPDRMLQMRARGFAARDAFADKLSGLILAEEAQDYPSIEGTVVSSEVVEPVVSLLDKLPEGLRDNVEKAFSTLNLAPGMRLAKVNEFMGGDGVDPEAGAQAILDWCRDEYAKRKTGQGRAKKGNAKKDATGDAERKGVADAGGSAGDAGRSGAVPVGVQQTHQLPDVPAEPAVAPEPPLPQEPDLF